jgi:DNA-binding NarL/FixJ family response regulator/DNA-binding SARP family transcriptional activator
VAEAVERPVRVLLVDDQELVRSGLRGILRPRDGFVIVGECADGADVPAAVGASDVDVIVMDLRMRNIDGIEATRRLRQAGVHPPVLALTTFDDDELLAGALRAGVAGYVLKDSPAEDVIRAVRTVAAGEAWLDTAVTARVLATYRQFADSRGVDLPSGLLTPREYEVLRGIGRGMTNAEIAAMLVISEVTVKSHIGRIFTKLGLRDRATAIVYTFDHGIVTPHRGDTPDRHLPLRDERSARQPNMISQQPQAPLAGSAIPEPSPRLRFAVLGPLRAWRDGIALDIGPLRQQALLTALLLRPDTTVSQRELLDGVWGFHPPGTNVVAVYVYRLRKTLQPDRGDEESLIKWDQSGYRFAGTAWVDTMRLEEIASEADASERHGDLAAAVDAWSRALELFRGEPLAGLPGPFAEGERRRLAERKTTLSLRKLDAQLRLGRHTEAVGELFALTQADPHNEPVAVLLIRALVASGRQVDALAVYAEFRRRLVSDLGVEPSEELRRVHQAALRAENTSLDIATGQNRLDKARPATRQ